VRLEYSPQAVADIRAAHVWWRENRIAARAMFRDELNQARRILATVPWQGVPARDVTRGSVRRLLLSKTQYLLYYEVDEGRGAVLVLRLWHTRRGGPPRLP
jgi:plasmid stabilization system protein ParE